MPSSSASDRTEQQQQPEPPTFQVRTVNLSYNLKRKDESRIKSRRGEEREPFMNFKVYWSGRSQFAMLHKCHKKTFCFEKSEMRVVCICLSWYLLTFGSFWKLISNRKILTSNDKRTYSSCIETFFSSFHVCIGLNLQQSKYRNACADKVTWTDKDKNLRVEVSSMYLSFFFKETSLEMV